MSGKGSITRIAGLVFVAVWLPLLVSGVGSLRSRGRLGESDALIVTGPYARVRHPLYAGLSFTTLGIGLALRWRGLALVGGVWLLVTRLWSIGEDRALGERFGRSYAVYRAATPAFVPGLARTSRPER